MRIRPAAVVLAFVSSILPGSIADARPCQGDLTGLSRHYPEFSFIESADVILVIKPSMDYAAIAGVERVVEGDIQRIEKGAAPRTIVLTAVTFTSPLHAGVPVKLFLKRFRDRDAYHVFGLGAPEIPPQVSIAVSANEGAGPIRVTTVGSWIGITALVTALDGLPAGLFDVDVYVGLMRPDGDTVWVTGNALAPTTITSPLPVPFFAGVPAKTTAFGATYRFSTDPPGWYFLNGVVVFAGTDPRDPCRWIDMSTFPFLVTPSLP